MLAVQTAKSVVGRILVSDIFPAPKNLFCEQASDSRIRPTPTESGRLKHCFQTVFFKLKPVIFAQVYHPKNKLAALSALNAKNKAMPSETFFRRHGCAMRAMTLCFDKANRIDTPACNRSVGFNGRFRRWASAIVPARRCRQCAIGRCRQRRFARLAQFAATRRGGNNAARYLHRL